MRAAWTFGSTAAAPNTTDCSKTAAEPLKRPRRQRPEQARNTENEQDREVHEARVHVDLTDQFIHSPLSPIRSAESRTASALRATHDMQLGSTSDRFFAIGYF